MNNENVKNIITLQKEINTFVSFLKLKEVEQKKSIPIKNGDNNCMIKIFSSIFINFLNSNLGSEYKKYFNCDITNKNICSFLQKIIDNYDDNIDFENLKTIITFIENNNLEHINIPEIKRNYLRISNSIII
jgi:hypothetical protein